MTTRKDHILEFVAAWPGRTDREITNAVDGREYGQKAVNQLCRQLEATGVLERRKRDDGLIGNYLTRQTKPPRSAPPRTADQHKRADNERNALQEDEVKKHLETWLHDKGWHTEIAWGHARGVDIEATKGSERWLIEVKGCGSRQPMRVNYFIGILGETLQRMEDPKARYTIALPDMAQFRGLWQRLPALAKKRTGIMALFVDADGTVREG